MRPHARTGGRRALAPSPGTTPAGRVVFTCEPDESAYNPIGAVHGGLVCTLLDSVTGCAIHSTLPQGKGYTSVEIKVNYLKAVRLDSGVLTATGTVVKAGSRVGFAEGVVTDARRTAAPWPRRHGHREPIRHHDRGRNQYLAQRPCGP